MNGSQCKGPTKIAVQVCVCVCKHICQICPKYGTGANHGTKSDFIRTAASVFMCIIRINKSWVSKCNFSFYLMVAAPLFNWLWDPCSCYLPKLNQFPLSMHRTAKKHILIGSRNSQNTGPLVHLTHAGGTVSRQNYGPSEQWAGPHLICWKGVRSPLRDGILQTVLCRTLKTWKANVIFL